MMKLFNKKTSLLLTTIFTLILLAHTAHAAGTGAGDIATFFGLNPFQLATEFFALTVNTGLMVMGWLLALAGLLLNISINLTLNIKSFVDATPAIYTTWTAIRDISSIFIIFLLLYSALVKIVGVETSPNYGSLLKNIVIFGILINFSFFITSLGIDASNIVSAQLYNGIIGNSNDAVPTQSFDVASMTATLHAPGISNVFMQSLQITSAYNVKFSDMSASGQITAPIKVILQGITGIIIEFTAAMSFILASIAFVIRFVILLVLLAFSPIWFAAHMLPQVKALQEKAHHWMDMYYSMLIFMPVYLLLMYMAINVLNSSPMFKNGYATAAVAGAAGDAWYSSFLVLGVNSFIVIFLLNMPLVVAISVGGTATDWAKKSSFTGKEIWRRFGSQAGSRTLGRAAYATGQSTAFKRLAISSPMLGSLASAGLSGVTKAGFGEKKGSYEDRLKAKSGNQEAINKQLGTVDKTRFDNTKKKTRKIEEYDKDGKIVEKEVDMTDQEYQTNRAKFYQQSYRQNLPWKNILTGKNVGEEGGPWYKAPGSIIGFMVDNRANRQTSAKLGSEANKKALIGKEKDIRKDKNLAEEELDKLKKAIADKGKTIGLVPGKPATADELKQVKDFEEKIAGYQKELDEIEETKEAEKMEKMVGAFAEKTKKEDSGGVGEDKPKEEKKP